MRLPIIESADALKALVREIGFLPLFKSSIPGFSVEELTPRERWFVDGVEGPWEWREALAESDEFAYGKLFARKAGFVSRDFFPHFVNFRRDGYDFDARYEDSLAPERCKRIVDFLEQNGPTLSGQLKRGVDIKGFDATLALLQMQTYVTVQRFEYRRDPLGVKHGFGVGRYALTEQIFGADFVEAAYEEEPKRSMEIIAAQLIEIMPDVSMDEALQFIKV